MQRKMAKENILNNSDNKGLTDLEEEALQKEKREHAEVILALSTIYTTIFRADGFRHALL